MKSQFSAKLKLFFCFLDEIRQNLNNYKKFETDFRLFKAVLLPNWTSQVHLVGLTLH